MPVLCFQTRRERKKKATKKKKDDQFALTFQVYFGVALQHFDCYEIVPPDVFVSRCQLGISKGPVKTGIQKYCGRVEMTNKIGENFGPECVKLKRLF